MIEIRFEPNRNRAAAYDGETLAGWCEFEPQAGVWEVTHTIVPEEYGGQGIAGRLVACVADAARAAGVQIDPVCWYAEKWLAKNAPELRV